MFASSCSTDCACELFSSVLKLKILTASEKDVLQAPVEAVNVDSQGEFCYLIENGILTKKYIKTDNSIKICYNTI